MAYSNNTERKEATIINEIIAILVKNNCTVADATYLLKRAESEITRSPVTVLDQKVQ